MSPFVDRFAWIFVAFAAVLLQAAPVHARCDVVAAAASLASARDAIDMACPCGAAESASAHARCARPVVKALVEDGSLERACKGEAMKHAKKSICGRPGAVVCCRVAPTGRTRHKIAREVGKCTSTPKLTACVSHFPSLDTGCDATGCVPECGDGTIDSGEECDPPNGSTCDATCHTPPACGDGTVDPGEACEPPGVGGCANDCQLASCAASEAGEIAIACVEGASSVGAGSGGLHYLVAWTGPLFRDEPDLLARRFDVDGTPVDPAALVASAGAPSGSTHFGPAVASDGGGYALGWSSLGLESGHQYLEIDARRIEDDGTLRPLDVLVHAFPFGQCQTTVGGPMSAASIASETFAVLFREVGSCQGMFFYEDPAGVIVDYGPMTPARTNVAIGYGVPTLPGTASKSAASVASAAGDTLAVWHAVRTAEAQPPFTFIWFVAASWIAPNGTSSQLSLSTRRSQIGGTRPGVAAGSSSFLVAWAQGATDDATTATEIRGMRVTHVGGGLDPDGGLLLATTGGAVRGGPVVAFDGSVWLVAWSETTGSGNDLRAVAVNPDGTVVDATPRLIASGLNDVAPALASAADGRVLAVYVRTDGAASAVRAKLVPGT